MSDELFQKAADLIRDSRKTVALTGAGISTPSGIPDFRSPGSGLWEAIDPIEVATIDAFMNRPDKFYKFMGPLADLAIKAEPNPAHDTLAKWEKDGLLHSVVTQNIDNLQQKAGSSNVLELHGSATSAYCVKCGKEYLADALRKKLEKHKVPRCDCPKKGVIKPNVVLFGEQLPFDVLAQSQKDSEECDIMIVVGSSLTVAPASMLPRAAHENGAKIIVINLQETYIDLVAEVVLRKRVETALPKIAGMI